jgi:hypothetical protein
MIAATLDVPHDAREREWLQTYIHTSITLPEALAQDSQAILAHLASPWCCL